MGVNAITGVTVTRPRIYGSIVENLGSQSETTTLYLFNLIEIPLESNGNTLEVYHIFCLIFAISLYLILIKIEPKK